MYWWATVAVVEKIELVLMGERPLVIVLTGLLVLKHIQVRLKILLWNVETCLLGVFGATSFHLLYDRFCIIWLSSPHTNNLMSLGMCIGMYDGHKSSIQSKIRMASWFSSFSWTLSGKRGVGKYSSNTLLSALKVRANWDKNALKLELQTKLSTVELFREIKGRLW